MKTRKIDVKSVIMKNTRGAFEAFANGGGFYTLRRDLAGQPEALSAAYALEKVGAKSARSRVRYALAN